MSSEIGYVPPKGSYVLCSESVVSNTRIADALLYSMHLRSWVELEELANRTFI